MSEIITRELTAAPGIYAIPSDRLHGSDAASGPRPLTAPGISAERNLALAADAGRIGYGEYWAHAGRIEARLTIEDVRSGRVATVLSAAADNPIDAASQLAQQISSRATIYSTHNVAALRDYVEGLESTDLAKRVEDFDQAIAADPGFAAPYLLLAQAKLQQRDGSGAQAVLNSALVHASAMPELERARLSFEAASLRGDAGGAENSLAAWARLAPSDPAVWTALAQTAMNHHAYARAEEFYRKAIAIEPSDVNLLNQLGYGAANAGDLNTATEALQRYAALRPADANPIDSLGDVNLLLGRLPQAENFYLQAIKKDPAFLNGGDYFKVAMARLMRGDVAGADKSAQQFVSARVSAKDPLAGFYRAEWLWISGRRKEAITAAEAFARANETGQSRQAASEAYGQLAVWQLALGRRAEAMAFAARAMQLEGPGSAGLAAVATFLAQAPASAAEWMARAARSFSSPAEKQLKQLALAYALLLDQQYEPAVQVLKPLYDTTAPAADDSLGLLLAWAYLETGKGKEAATLVRFNPVPSATTIKPFLVFYFPRLFYLRGRLAELAGDKNQAASQFRLFRQLSGGTALVWGEEARVSTSAGAA